MHDWLYTLGTPGDGKTRKLADLTFRRALALVGVRFFRRNLMYWAVRIGGRSGYGLESRYGWVDNGCHKRLLVTNYRHLFYVFIQTQTGFDFLWS
ncbi:MAG: hypothetical protein B7Z20_11925, partial [Sphingobium sp. 32-64-5]